MISTGVAVIVAAPSGIMILCSKAPVDDTYTADAFNRSTMKRRLACLSIAALLLVACAARIAPPGPSTIRPEETDNAFVMPDGTLLPYREWLPSRPLRAIVLALHGMNDSRDAWEYPGPAFADAGIALFSPDLRGFGATSSRGLWPGTNGLARDARVMARLLKTRYPNTRLILMAESMGAAVLMVMASQPDPPAAAAYVLIAPAVWGRSKMNFLMRASLWLADNLIPGMRVTGDGLVKVTATDNKEALHRLSTDPLTIHATRVDAIKGLVDLMDQALVAAPHLRVPALLLYGGHDQLIPPRATAAIWKPLPKSATLAFYPDGYHLLLRDRERSVPIGDILAWIRDPTQSLPSGADQAALKWLATQR